jgi:hypothetical protein
MRISSDPTDPGFAEYATGGPWRVFFEGEEGRCYIVSGDIAADAVCKLWIIPEGRMSQEEKKPEPDAVDGKVAEDTRAEQENIDIAVKLASLKATILRTQLHGAG